VGSNQWRAEKGDYSVLVGSSSEQIELKGNVMLAAEATEK
jgi:hypothetical protein